MSRLRLLLALVIGSIVGGGAWAASNPSILAEVSAALGVNNAIRQILHIGDDGGIGATLHTVVDIDGDSSALSISTGAVSVAGDFGFSGTIDSLQFTTGLTAPAHSEGLVFYDDNEKTLAVYNNQADVTLQLGQELYIFATNKTGSTITNGTLVYIVGAQGNRPTVALAQSDAVVTSSAVAIATHDVGNNLSGFFTTFGLVRGLDTSADTAGTTLWLSADTAGRWTSTIPNAPNFNIQVGRVIVSNVNSGAILVSIGPTDVTGHMVIQSICLNDTLGISGDVTYKGGGGIAFGHMYMDGDFTTTIGDASQTEVDTGLVTGNVHMITFPDDHYLTVPVDGHYVVSWNMSFNLANAAGQPEIHGGIMVNGTGMDEDGEGHRSILTANDVGSMGSNTILDLSANDQVSIFVQNQTNTQDIIVGHLNVTLWMSGGT